MMKFAYNLFLWIQILKVYVLQIIAINLQYCASFHIVSTRFPLEFAFFTNKSYFHKQYEIMIMLLLFIKIIIIFACDLQ